MGFFDNLGKTISDAGQSTVQKGREMADQAKLKNQIAEEERKIDDCYKEIGKLYFEAHADEPEENAAGYVEEIKTSLASIREWKDQINKLKGVAACPSCGAEVKTGALFCSSCGAKIEQPEPEEEEAPAGKFCGSCGAPIAEGAKFCTSCGQPVEE